MDELPQLLVDISHRLHHVKIPFHFTGGIVVGIYGEMRFTQGVDIVLKVGEPTIVARLAEVLADDYFVDRESLETAAKTSDLARALHLPTGIKIDLHFGEAIPGELERSVEVPFLPNCVIPIPSREDALVSKLLWVRLGSQRSRKDVVAMLRNPAPIDRSRVADLAAQLDLTTVWTELESIAAPDTPGQRLH